MNKKFSTVLRWGLLPLFVVLGLVASLFFDSSIVRTVGFVSIFVVWPFIFVFSDSGYQWWTNRKADEKNAIAILAVVVFIITYFLLSESLRSSVLAGDTQTVEATLLDWTYGGCRSGCSKMGYSYSVSGKVFEKEEILREYAIQRLQGRCFYAWGTQTRPSRAFVTYSVAFPSVSRVVPQYDMPSSSFENWRRSNYPNSSIPDSLILSKWCGYVPGK